MQTLFALALTLLLFGFVWLNEHYTFEQLGLSSLLAIGLFLVVSLVNVSS